jgi:hypothetical protein
LLLIMKSLLSTVLNQKFLIHSIFKIAAKKKNDENSA